jgi:hypothetical protein
VAGGRKGRMEAGCTGPRIGRLARGVLPGASCQGNLAGPTLPVLTAAGAPL